MIAVMLGIATTPTGDYSPPVHESVASAPDTTSNAIPEYGMACIPEVVYICNDGGCKPMTPASDQRTILDDEKGLIHRCDDRGCDAYLVDKRTGGAYISYQRDVG